MNPRRLLFAAILLALPAISHAQTLAASPLSPAGMKRIGTVNERYQSYNMEMLEVTGGRFWKPYKSIGKPAAPSPGAASVPSGLPADLYEYRGPIDLSNARLRKLAAALGPAYLRVSGTWANSTFFQDAPGPDLAKPPEGFGGVLTAQQWKGVVAFSKSANAALMTSFATSVGTRDAAGLWTPKEANKFLTATRAAGGSIAATEFMNEPTFASIGGAPKGYDAAAYARDLAVFRPYLKKQSPGTILLGPGGVGEGGGFIVSRPGAVLSKDILAATGDIFDAFSYHVYGAVSNRCGKGTPIGTTADDALSAQWLGRTVATEAFYQKLRDQFMPGKPIWLTEAGDAACGGNPWAATFLDSFRYLHELGALAQRGVQVVAHNTLAASDYGLLEEGTYNPRPNYWSAVLWRRLMDKTVLDPGAASAPDLYVFAHCLRGVPGGVALLAINAGGGSQSLNVAAASDRYTLSASELQSEHVMLNGIQLDLGAGDTLPPMKGVKTGAGAITLDSSTITFLAIPKAGNAACMLR